MYLAIIVLPLLGSIVSGFFGRKVGVNGAQFLSSICVVVTTLFAVAIFFEVAFNNISVSLSLFRWVDVELLNVSWGFNFDSLTVSMLIPVLIISSLVHIYSIGYMSHDPHNQRFFSYLSLFTFMMIILVTANNFLLMFVGWEGVGVCSYLLVNFWFTRIAANQSSLSAFLTNRVGDCFLTIGMLIILLTFGNLDYSTVFSLAPFVSEDSVTIIGICLLIGAMAKSSQFGLHVWLPLAMEGPTPVSALIHAATMVTAGVYLLMRTSPLIEYSSTVLLTCLWIGSVTTVFSSLIGLFQQDIKKVIAYSTMSQLGMMVIAVGLSSYNIALFHLINHAFYKGLLFLGAGAVIHSIADNQDFRRYGGFIMFLPLSYTVMLIASLSLVAFPFMTGFYSKDFILESSFAQYTYSGTAVYYTALIGAIFTTLYSVKVLYLTFITTASAPIVNYNNSHEGNIFMSLPLVILALFSIFFGFFTKDAFIGLGSGLFTDNSLFIHPLHETTINSEFGVPYAFKLLPFILTTLVSVISLMILEFYPKILLNLTFTRIGYNIFTFLNLRFLIEYIYNRYVAYFILNIGSHTTKILDKGSIEKIGPYGLEKVLIMLSKNLNTLSTGIVTTYALYILIGFILYVSLPYILMDSHILILMVYCSILFTIKFDKILIKNITYSNNLTPYKIVNTNMVWTICVITISGVVYAIYTDTGSVVTNVIDTIYNISANKSADIDEFSNILATKSIFAGEYSDVINNNNIYKILTTKNVYIYEINSNAIKIMADFIKIDFVFNDIYNAASKTMILDNYSLDQMAENLTNRINQDFTWFKHYIFSPEFPKNTCLAAAGALISALVFYKAVLWYEFYYCYDLYDMAPVEYHFRGIHIPYTNIDLFGYYYNRMQQSLPVPSLIDGSPLNYPGIDFDFESTIRHIFFIYRNDWSDDNLTIETEAIARGIWGERLQTYNVLDFYLKLSDLLPEPWHFEFILNYSDIFTNL